MRIAVRCWLVTGLSIACGTTMLFLGALFMRQTYFSLSPLRAEAAVCSLLFAVLLLVAGGGLLCSTMNQGKREAGR